MRSSASSVRSGLDFSIKSKCLDPLQGGSCADVVFAKGMGNYETLSELPQEGRFFYIFRGKCPPVVRSLGWG